MPANKTLLHVHTDYSFDSNITLESLARFVDHHGFDCVAVTDHDAIEGAIRLRELTEATVIIGEEVSTSDGHLLGLFLEQHVKPGRSARDTALAIRDQGGLVFVPHPFVGAFGCGLNDAAWEIADLIDAVEVCNAQNLSAAADRRAAAFAEQTGAAAFVGADSHAVSSIAPCYQIMSAFSGAAEFLDALRKAELVRGRHPFYYFAGTAYRLARYFAGFDLPEAFGASMTGPRNRSAKSPQVNLIID